jgi:hypothetical protein
MCHADIKATPASQERRIHGNRGRTKSSVRSSHEAPEGRTGAPPGSCLEAAAGTAATSEVAVSAEGGTAPSANSIITGDAAALSGAGPWNARRDPPAVVAPGETVHTVTTGRRTISPSAPQETAQRTWGELRRSSCSAAARSSATAAPCQRKWMRAQPILSASEFDRSEPATAFIALPPRVRPREP